MFAINCAFETFTRATAKAHRRSRIGERFSGCDDHLQTQPFQPANQPALHPLRMLPIEEITAEFFILSLIAQEAPFKVAQIVALLIFGFLEIRAAFKFHTDLPTTRGSWQSKPRDGFCR